MPHFPLHVRAAGPTPAACADGTRATAQTGSVPPPLAWRMPARDHGAVRILVTGHRGYVGGPVAGHLERLGHDVAGFDRADGDDLLDPAAVRRATDGCAAIVHLGALARDTAGSPEQIMAVNVLGTWHVLLAAEAAAAGRVICFSSMQVLGIAGGERLPDYFPVDDEHPRRATRP
jgi:UDP-glucose 4-epimerase